MLRGKLWTAAPRISSAKFEEILFYGLFLLKKLKGCNYKLYRDAFGIFTYYLDNLDWNREDVIFSKISSVFDVMVAILVLFSKNVVFFRM